MSFLKGDVHLRVLCGSQTCSTGTHFPCLINFTVLGLEGVC